MERPWRLGTIINSRDSPIDYHMDDGILPPQYLYQEANSKANAFEDCDTIDLMKIFKPIHLSGFRHWLRGFHICSFELN